MVVVLYGEVRIVDVRRSVVDVRGETDDILIVTGRFGPVSGCIKQFIRSLFKDNTST